jgi:RNA recognition motif-containing protein
MEAKQAAEEAAEQALADAAQQQVSDAEADAEAEVEFDPDVDYGDDLDLPEVPGAAAPEQEVEYDPGGTVFVGNLPWEVTEDEIREAFAEVGEVDDVRLLLVLHILL